jgi:hypothetical protein
MEVVREQQRELAHARELFALVCERVHTWWCCARPFPEEEAWTLRRRRSTVMTDSSLAAPSVTASEEEAESGERSAERKRSRPIKQTSP